MCGLPDSGVITTTERNESYALVGSGNHREGQKTLIFIFLGTRMFAWFGYCQNSSGPYEISYFDFVTFL
jgi:hypothetical protein